MFDSLSNKMSSIVKKISGKSKISEANIEEMLKEVRTSLLEADVNFKVVKQFVNSVKEQAIGTKVLDSLEPSEMLIKIVNDELINLLGSEETSINYNENGITNIIMVGLQGTGKTTSCAKLANLLVTKENKNVLLVACDLIRPAAVEQLKTLGNSINVEVFSLGLDVDVYETSRKALEYAKEKKYDTVIFDTSGRLHIDEALMNELVELKSIIKPNEILLTVDAMTGQDIINVSTTFNDTLEITGLVATKMDGDSRGGGILSVKSLTNVPVKLVGIGEKIKDLDIFYPDRMANRILGMGDILTLVEKAQEDFDEAQQEKMIERMMSGIFTMDDMLVQLKQIKKLGSMSGIMKMIPGMNQYAGMIKDSDASSMIKISESIINSMTLEERADPSIIRNSRKERIAEGSGNKVSEVSKVLTQYDRTKKAMSSISGMMNNPNMDDLNGMDMDALLKQATQRKVAGPANGNQKKFVSKLNKKRR